MVIGRRTFRAVPLGLLALIAVVVALVAGGAGSAGATSVGASAAANTCGKAPVGKPPALLNSLPPQTKSYYNGFNDALGKSHRRSTSPSTVASSPSASRSMP